MMKYFISGHRDLSQEEFNEIYVPAIDKAASNNFEEVEFVVGDCQGVDKMAMDYILDETFCALSIYHMFESPRNTPGGDSIEECEECGIQFIGGFQSDEERDAAMTAMSDYDIAFVKNNRWNSGTAQNIKRRHNIK